MGHADRAARPLDVMAPGGVLGPVPGAAGLPKPLVWVDHLDWIGVRFWFMLEAVGSRFSVWPIASCGFICCHHGTQVLDPTHRQ